MMMMMGDLGWCRRLVGCRGSGAGCCRWAAGGEIRVSFTLQPKHVPRVGGTHPHHCPHQRIWGTEPSPAPCRTPPLTVARRAGRQRRRPGPCTAAPGDTQTLSTLEAPFCPPPCVGGTLSHSYPARPGLAAGPAAVGQVFGAGGLPGGEVDAEMGAPVECLPGEQGPWWLPSADGERGPTGMGAGAAPPPSPAPLLPSWRLPASSAAAAPARGSPAPSVPGRGEQAAPEARQHPRPAARLPAPAPCGRESGGTREAAGSSGSGIGCQLCAGPQLLRLRLQDKHWAPLPWGRDRVAGVFLGRVPWWVPARTWRRCRADPPPRPLPSVHSPFHSVTVQVMTPGSIQLPLLPSRV